MVFTVSLLGAHHEGDSFWLCPWARQLTGCLDLHVADRWSDQAVYPAWWPSLTKDMQTEHELIRMHERIERRAVLNIAPFGVRWGKIKFISLATVQVQRFIKIVVQVHQGHIFKIWFWFVFGLGFESDSKIKQFTSSFWIDFCVLL